MMEMDFLEAAVKKYSVLPSAREHLDAINTNQMH
jgi:hypothetical protein